MPAYHGYSAAGGHVIRTREHRPTSASHDRRGPVRPARGGHVARTRRRSGIPAGGGGRGGGGDPGARACDPKDATGRPDRTAQAAQGGSAQEQAGSTAHLGVRAPRHRVHHLPRTCLYGFGGAAVVPHPLVGRAGLQTLQVADAIGTPARIPRRKRQGVAVRQAPLGNSMFGPLRLNWFGPVGLPPLRQLRPLEPPGPCRPGFVAGPRCGAIAAGRPRARTSGGSPGDGFGTVPFTRLPHRRSRSTESNPRRGVDAAWAWAGGGPDADEGGKRASPAESCVPDRCRPATSPFGFRDPAAGAPGHPIHLHSGAPDMHRSPATTAILVCGAAPADRAASAGCHAAPHMTGERTPPTNPFDPERPKA